MNAFTRLFQKGQTPQTQPIPGAAQVANSAGGYTFAVDDWTRLERFLILGTDGGTYYATERAITIENAEVVRHCLAADPARTVATIRAISDSGRAPKNAPAVFALAVAAGSGHLRAVAEADALRAVCRTPTDLFAFASTVQCLRGWGSGLRRLVAAWYAGIDPDRLGYLVTKYAQRDGWTHRDLFRLVHPHAPTPEHQAVYRWVIAGSAGLGDRTVARRVRPPASPGLKLPEPAAAVATIERAYPAVATLPPIIDAFEVLRRVTDVRVVVRLIHEHNLAREHVPSQWLNEPKVWHALLAKMPATALIRNLGKLTSVGLLAPLSEASKLVADRLGDGDWLRRSRLHPMAILLAAKVYGAGKGVKGKLSWTPVPQVVAALDAAFYRAFATVTPTGKRRLVAIDVSGSMDGSMAAGTSLTCREAAAALSLIVAKTEPDAHIVGFASSGSGYGGMHGGGDARLAPLDLSAVSTIAGAVAQAQAIPMGGTDCSLPMRVALKEGWQVDSFEVYTDNETWAGPVHPVQALQKYRAETGIAAKLVVQAFTATPFTIADPQDAGSLDVVGLDAASPGIVADFIRG